ncbi:DUF1223 domain-containing protein [Blastomonas natatoria]|nr:DUF1223 domain-containing protein [Blastomonas natatoria]
MLKFWVPLLAVTGLAGFVMFNARVEPPSAAHAAQAASPAALTPSTAGPVVAELFTSQGCSSCPPADAVAARLARDPAILVISRPVTYWDRLGWKDSLGREENTRLQRQYGDKAFAGANIYTPQLVVDGRAQAVGSQEAKVRSLLATVAVARRKSGLSVRIAAAGMGKQVMLDGAGGQQAELVLVALASGRTVSIGAGENGGRKVHYTNVVLAERNLGAWTGGAQTVTITPDMLRVAGADRHALLVRQGPGGPVIGSAVI